MTTSNYCSGVAKEDIVPYNICVFERIENFAGRDSIAGYIRLIKSKEDLNKDLVVAFPDENNNIIKSGRCVTCEFISIQSRTMFI